MEKLQQLMAYYEPNDPESIQKSFARHLEYSLACTRFNFTMQDAYRAAGLVLRDRLLESLNDTNTYYREQDVKRGYYLSAEYLIGRHMQNAIANLDLEQPFKDAFEDLGMKLEELFSEEADPALGNGGLGRLAACFLDSMATLSLPCWGYGIRYSYGMFKQGIKDGRQIEEPDFWIGDGCPFEIPRPDVTYPVRFYGRVEEVYENGRSVSRWVGGEIVQAMAYDNPIPGFDTYNTNNLRLWRACPSEEFDLDAFSSAQFQDAITQRRKAEDLSAVLYPNDATYAGRELRLRQQYFFVSASLQDLLREFIKRPNYQWEDLPQKVAVQMNDTHPTIAVAEFMRLLVDVQQLDWDRAWELTRKCLNYTNHTVMPEALEKWPVEMMERMLPRHLQIIYHINGIWIQKLLQRWGDGPIIAALSIVEEGDIKKIRMGHLAIIGSNKINGVAALHTEIIKKETFPEFYKWCCDNGEHDKIVNMTNGVTPRRWIHCANPALSEIFTKYLGSQEWLTDMTKLKGMLDYKDDSKLHDEWMAMKSGCKAKLVDWLKSTMDLDIDQDALIDIQIKRIHEYKRQLMNILFVIHRYLDLKKKSPGERAAAQKRVVLIGGKAASAYVNAKIIIKLINNVAKVINNDPETQQYLKCAFVPNYCVSAAQVMIPASDISEHISTAGTEASGTSNMKFVMNGGLIVGTMDGANIEIREECGHDTMFIFGCQENEVAGIAARAQEGHYPIDGRLQAVFDEIRSGKFAGQAEPEAQGEFESLINRMCNTRAAGTWDGDRYLVIHDFPSFIDAQARVDETYKNRHQWCKLSIQAAASMAQFSTDRTMREYSKVIWEIEPARRPVNEEMAARKQAVGKDKETIAKEAAENAAAKEAAAKEAAQTAAVKEAAAKEAAKEAATKDALAKEAAKEAAAKDAAAKKAAKDASEKEVAAKEAARDAAAKDAAAKKAQKDATIKREAADKEASKADAKAAPGRGQTVAVLDVRGSSRQILGETDDGQIVNEWAPLGSMTNYDGSGTHFTTMAGSLSWSLLAVIACQVASAAEAFWNSSLLHRDLAARNVLVFSLDPPLVKLTDFGLVATSGQERFTWPKGHAMGTRWMAPESQPDSDFHFDDKTEIYTFGCFLFELATRGTLVPYSRTGNDRIPALKRSGALPWADLGAAPSFPAGFRQLIEMCCERLPGNRPSFGQLQKYLQRLRETDGESILPASTMACPLNEDPSKPWVPTSPLLRVFDRDSVLPAELSDLQAKTTVWRMSRDQVYSLPLFSDTACDALLEDLILFHRAGRQTSRANSNNRFSLRLSELGYEPFLRALVEEVASPLFGQLQVNIGGDWLGGGLKFFEDDSEEPSLTLPQAKGQAFLHRGKIRHQRVWMWLLVFAPVCVLSLSVPPTGPKQAELRTTWSTAPEITRRLWSSFATLGLGLGTVTSKTEAAESALPVRSETVEVPGANEFSPWNKPRDYRACMLANGLRVLLVSDMETSKVEAAFTAGFGQFDDPETSGVAHLTEHLLLSSPGPNGAEPLETWLEEPARDGDSNGFTAFDNALFTVSSNMNEWRSALSRFAHCFRPATPDDARFQASAVQREVLRVDDELNGRPSAAVRNLQLLRRRAVSGHPLRRFGPGSLKTLLPRGQVRQDLAELGTVCQAFFERHVCAETSTLAVVAAVPLDELEEAVAFAFQDVQTKVKSFNRIAVPDPLPEPSGGALIPPCFVVDVSANPAVSITWSIPFTDASASTASFRASKPQVVLSHLIAHQGPGSLSAWLREKGWVPANLGPKVSAQTVFITESGFALWEIKVRLSPRGLTQWHQVVAAVFGLLAALRQSRKKGGGRDVLSEAADEVSALADVAWRFPPRPPLARELALDMRSAPRPAAYVCASRRIFSATEWGPSAGAWRNMDQTEKAARFTSPLAREASSDEAGRMLDRLLPQLGRMTLFSTTPQAITPMQDPDLGLDYGELRVSNADQEKWILASSTPPDWWQMPAKNLYLSKAEKIERSSLLAPGKAVMGKPNKKVNGVYWSDSCRPTQIRMPASQVTQATPKFVWDVPGCIYVSGQFNELVVPLGEEPLVTLTLWLPAARVAEASLQQRAAGRVWLKSLQCELESPFYGAALAGCRWEVAFFTTGSELSDSGMRLCFQGYCDNIVTFVPDAVRAIVGHVAPSSENFESLRTLAIAEVPARGAEMSKLVACLKSLQISDIRDEVEALWTSVSRSFGSSQGLVAGALEKEQASELVRDAIELLPLHIGGPSNPPLNSSEPLPPAVLTRRPSWQGPVAQSLCLASGLPELLDVCGRTWR
ncbi:glpV [Symbiodinium microadriaticum]|nr:glpV [Symbiodinium microadriaticum]